MMDFFYQGQEEQYQFFRFPKKLITDSKYRDMSMEAKVLYGLMLDRIGLSRSNQWFDEEGRIYIIYTVAQIETDLNSGHNKAINAKKELEEIGLIRVVKRGQGKPDLLYVMNFMTSDDKDKQFETSNTSAEVCKTNVKEFKDNIPRNCTSQPQEIWLQNPNHNDGSDTDEDVVVHPSDADPHIKILNRWNSTEGVTPIKCIAKDTKRASLVDSCLQQFGEDAIFEAMDKISQSSYLRQKKTQFNWFFNPDNLIKVLEGNYDLQFTKTKKQNSFLNYDQRSYDYGCLEERLFNI